MLSASRPRERSCPPRGRRPRVWCSAGKNGGEVEAAPTERLGQMGLFPGIPGGGLRELLPLFLPRPLTGGSVGLCLDALFCGQVMLMSCTCLGISRRPSQTSECSINMNRRPYYRCLQCCDIFHLRISKHTRHLSPTASSPG